MTESTNPAPGTLSPAEAQAALDSVRATRRGVNDRLVIPRGYDAIYSLNCGLLVLAVAFINAHRGGIVLEIIGAALLAVGLGTFVALVQWFRRVNGFWISGIKPPRARWVAWGAGVVAGVGVFGASLAGDGGHWGLVGLVVVVVTAAAYGLSRLWLSVYRAEAARG